MIYLLIPAALVFLGYVIFKIKWWHMETCAAIIPGDKPYPIIGNGNLFFGIKSATDIWVRLNYLFDKYFEHGIAKIWFGPLFVVTIWEPEYVKIIATNPNSANKSIAYQIVFGDLLKGAFVTDGGVKAKELRKPIMKTLGKKLFDTNYHYVFVNKGKAFVEHIRLHKQGKEFDVLHTVAGVISDMFSETHLGVPTDELRAPRFNYVENFGIFMDTTLQSILKYQLYIWRLIIFFTGARKKLLEAIENCRNFHHWVLEYRKKIPNEYKGEIEMYPDFLLKRGIEKNLPQQELEAELGDVILAGTDTSTVVASSTLLFLAMFPEVQEKAYQEQLSIFEDSDRDPTTEDVASMEYLAMVIKESLRLIAAPGIFKACENDVELDKYILPKGTLIYLSIQKIHRNSKYWEKPTSFYPEHFLPEKESARPHYAYFPFGCGPRICPGSAYGMVSIKVLLSSVLRNFKLSSSIKFDNIIYEYKLLLQISPGYHVKFEERNKS